MRGRENLGNQNPRTTESAATARFIESSKNSILDEGFERGYSTSELRRRGPDDRTPWQFLVDEVARFGQDLVGLREFCGGIVQVWEGQPSHGIDDTGQGLRDRISALIVPKPEVVNLYAADAH